jgi:parallel beta-helix repeat protein
VRDVLRRTGGGGRAELPSAEGAAGHPPEAGSERHRRWPLFASLALWAGLAVAGSLLYVRHDGARPLARRLGTPVTFSHVYPQDPVPFERPAVGTSSPYVPPAQRVHTGKAVASMTDLVSVLPKGTFSRLSANRWLLRYPIEFGTGTSLSLRGHLSLELAPGAFILAQHRASVTLSGVTLVGVDAHVRPQSQPVKGRAFIDVRSGASIVLTHDTFRDLGHLGDQTYGVTLDGAAPTSKMVSCTTERDFFGVYLARLRGGLVEHSRFTDSVIYGIDPHTHDTGLTIFDNTVTRSGVHGIVLADHASHNKVLDNSVSGSRDHGIVIFESSNDNVLAGNVVAHTFDGVVISNSSGNRLVGNEIGPVTRFGVRVSGTSNSNVLSRNVVGGAIVGLYVYGGATGTWVTGNTFGRNYENVRVRDDAPANYVTPNPGRSEL